MPVYDQPYISRNYRLKLHRRHFKKLLQNVKKLKIQRQNKTITNDLYKRSIDDIFKSLENKMANEDYRIFSNISGLRVLLDQLIPMTDVDKMIEHEIEHGQKASELGYSVEYGVYLFRKGFFVMGVVPFCKTAEEVKTFEDREIILNSPQKPSAFDKLSSYINT